MFLFFLVSTKPKNQQQINKPGVWWTEGVGFGISSIASSSLGDRKKGYPKRQALWEKKPLILIHSDFRLLAAELRYLGLGTQGGDQESWISGYWQLGFGTLA